MCKLTQIFIDYFKKRNHIFKWTLVFDIYDVIEKKRSIITKFRALYKATYLLNVPTLGIKYELELNF